MINKSLPLEESKNRINITLDKETSDTNTEENTESEPFIVVEDSESQTDSQSIKILSFPITSISKLTSILFLFLLSL